MFVAAAVQLTGSSDETACLEQAEMLIRRAATYGATLIVTPEATNFLGPHAEKVRRAEPLGGALCVRFSALAKALSVTLVIGSINEHTGDVGRCANTTLVFGPDGVMLASYRKIHLFDVDVSDAVRFKESDTAVAGEATVVAVTDVGRLGLSICYDLRFGELYRRLVADGAEILLVPSAFTATTGRDHWEPLLRARAIESQAWVIAPGQVGPHDDNGLNESYGRSCIIDPWGVVVAQCPDGPGLALAEIDLDRVATARRGMPVADHRRLGG